MRDYKFRAWDKENKTMYEVVLLGEHILNLKGGGWENREDFIAMQYTGIKDKNGKEIFEGDIARQGKRLYIAAWANDVASFVWRPTDGSNTYPCFNIGTVKSMEVIGNIHDNPELLEEGEYTAQSRNKE